MKSCLRTQQVSRNMDINRFNTSILHDKEDINSLAYTQVVLLIVDSPINEHAKLVIPLSSYSFFELSKTGNEMNMNDQYSQNEISEQYCISFVFILIIDKGHFIKKCYNINYGRNCGY